MKRQNQQFAVASSIVLVCLTFLHQAGWAQPIVYVGTNAATGVSQLRVINSDGTGDRLLPVALPGPGVPSFSKDGRFMAVTSQSPGAPNQYSKNVFLLNLLTAQLSQITAFQDQVSATNFTYVSPFYHSLSPDSAYIAVWDLISNRDGNTPKLAIYRVADGFPLVIIVANRVRTGTTQGGDGVDWHPTQYLLVYPLDLDIPFYDYDSGVYIGNGEGAAVLMAPTDGSPAVQLTSPHGYRQISGNRTLWAGESDYAPAYSPNGQQVAYVRATYIADSAAPSFRQPSYSSLRIVNTNGSNDHEVLALSQGTYVTHLAWSRNGTQLVYDAGTQFMTNGSPFDAVDLATDALWIVNTNGTSMHSVRGALSGFPAWSPAGTTFCNLGVTAGGGAAGSIDDCGAPLNLKGTRMPSGQYRVDITGGISNLLYRVLASTNLTTWQTIGTTPRTNTTTSFVDAGASSLARRFYRVVLGN